MLEPSRSPTPKWQRIVQWVGSFLYGAGSAALVAYVVLGFLPWQVASALFVLMVPSFTVFWVWLFIERPQQLEKKLRLNKTNERQMKREALNHRNWPPNKG